LMASFCDLLFYSAGYSFRYRKNITKYNKEH
jgi:hypothetical protein